MNFSGYSLISVSHSIKTKSFVFWELFKVKPVGSHGTVFAIDFFPSARVSAFYYRKIALLDYSIYVRSMPAAV